MPASQPASQPGGACGALPGSHEEWDGSTAGSFLWDSPGLPEVSHTGKALGLCGSEVLVGWIERNTERCEEEGRCFAAGVLQVSVQWELGIALRLG